MLGEPTDGTPPLTELHASEGQLISAFCRFVQQLDPDLILGWNVIEFDLAVLQRRAAVLGISLPLGRDGSGVELTSGKPARARIAGRVVLDGIGSLRAASHMLESYALSDVAERFLGRSKALDNPGADRVAEIRRMFEHDRPALAHYNLEDCRLARDIFARADLLGFLLQRAQLTGLPLDRVRGAVAAFDYLYLPRLHRSGFVANTVGSLQDAASSPGGYVLDSVPGLHDNVIVLDFKSLYPSIIRTFCIDPLGLWAAHEDQDPIAGFLGARFHRSRHILPQLLTQLWHSRDEAKLRQDAARSYAIKILMNSFYGILGTPACRFFDPKLASSITLRGHEIITGSKAFLEALGYTVIYGDTDSLFVQLSSESSAEVCVARGQELAAALNVHWTERIARDHGLPSQLEVELDTHYLKFFMPTLRDFVQGSKKRYAGLTHGPSGYAVEFKGMEAVRTDWTPLARRFQRALYRRIFLGEPYVDLVRQTVAALYAGQLDAELVYKKRLRRELAQYVKNVPPHVRAARKLTGSAREVAYFMTVRGPEPVGARSSTLDYRHYVDRQLAPAADTLLHYLGTSLAQIVDRQLSLF
jgi:DNA polymerase-2